MSPWSYGRLQSLGWTSGLDWWSGLTFKIIYTLGLFVDGHSNYLTYSWGCRVTKYSEHIYQTHACELPLIGLTFFVLSGGWKWIFILFKKHPKVSSNSICITQVRRLCSLQFNLLISTGRSHFFIHWTCLPYLLLLVWALLRSVLADAVLH